MTLRSLLLAGLSATLLLSGCAHVTAPSGKKITADQPSVGDEDLLEPFNRSMYRFNYVVDGVVLKPVTSIYRGVVPERGRIAVSNALENIYTPVVFFNSVLQGDPNNSFTSLWRFILNSTFGLGGVYDVASEVGLKNRDTDFGQTLAMWGLDSGPYLVLPIIGPSNLRDATGRVADALMNPFNHMGSEVSYPLWGATAVDARSDNMKLIDDVYSSSLDPYATFRSGYTQKRVSAIARAKAARDKALEHSACGNP